MMWLLAILGAAIGPTAYVHGQAAGPQEQTPTTQATTPATQPAPMDGLSKLAPLDAPPTTLAELAKPYPYFRHAPFDQAGVNPLVLPFHYRDTTGQGAAEEALAFSFLVSMDLDWLPENYTTRHAYFIYKKQIPEFIALTYQNDAAMITQILQYWRATHAVGGEICRQEKGYTGTLLIFDTQGAVTHRESFDTPRPYFDLLGDMDVAVMQTLGSPPGAKLAAYLHQPRCKAPQSLIVLGKAAFASARTKQDFSFYTAILDHDPDFAEARHWLANQSWWKDQDRPSYEKQIALALHSRLNPDWLDNFHPGQCPDQELAAEYPHWLEQAAQLVGDDAPVMTGIHLDSINAQGRPATEFLESVEKVVAAHPNRGNLVRAFGTGCSEAPGYYDGEMGVSCYLSVMQSRFLPPVDLTWEAQATADLWLSLGRPRPALQILRTAQRRWPFTERTQLLAWLHAGRFDDVLQWYHQQSKPELMQELEDVQFVALAACVRGDADTLRQLLYTQSWPLAKNRVAVIYANCLAEMEGRPFESQAQPKWFDGLQQWQYTPAVLATADRDLRSGRAAYRFCVNQVVQLEPGQRLGWVLWDQYLRMNPKPNMWRFYLGLEFMHGDDPWVVEALARWRSLDVPLPPAQVVENFPLLKDVPAPATPVDDGQVLYYIDMAKALGPWDAAARVRQLLEAGRKGEALTLARKYRQVATRTKQSTTLYFAQSLVHRAEDALAAATQPADATAGGDGLEPTSATAPVP